MLARTQGTKPFSSVHRGFVKPREFIKNLLARTQGTKPFSSLYQGFVKPKESIKNLLARTQGTKLFSSLYQGFVKPREFIKNLLARTQGTKHLVRYTGKFFISRVRYTGIQPYLQIAMLLTFKIFGRARNHGKKFPKLRQTSFTGIADCVALVVTHISSEIGGFSESLI